MPDLELMVAARPENVAVIRRAVDALLDGLSVDGERRGDVILAVGEACANAVMHAYIDREPAGLALRAQAVGAVLEIVVSDEGRGMQPRPDSPGLGLGLPMIARLAHATELRERDGGGTEVWMTFELPGDVSGGDTRRFARSA